MRLRRRVSRLHHVDFRRRRAGFRHHRPDFRRRCSVRSRNAMEPNSCDSVRSRNATEPDSCGSVRNKSVARSRSVWAADCKNFCRWLARKAATLGRWSRKTEHLGGPTADDWLGCHGLIPRGNFLPGWNFQNQMADGHGHWYFPGLPRCARYCRYAAHRCCPLLPGSCGWSSPRQREDGSETVPADVNSSWMTAPCCALAHFPSSPKSARRY